MRLPGCQYGLVSLLLRLNENGPHPGCCKAASPLDETVG